MNINDIGQLLEKLGIQNSDSSLQSRSLPILDELEGRLKLLAGRQPEQIKSVLRELEPMFALALPSNSTVVVEFGSCTLVHAQTRTDALKLFVAKFGRNAHGWAFNTGPVMAIGAGTCLN